MKELVYAPVDSYFANVNLTEVYRDIFQLLWYSQLPCFSIPEFDISGILSHCSWRGVRVDCKELFNTVPTDSGMCCAFNMDSDMLRDSLYKDMLEDMKEENNEKDKRKNYEVLAGKKNGLTVRLDNHYNEVTFGSVFDDASGMEVFVGDKKEFPLLKQRGKMLSPGREHFLDISAYIVEADTDIKSSLSPNKRGCFFQSESQLSYFSSYTMNNCRFECGLKHVERSIGCVPWYFPRG